MPRTVKVPDDFLSAFELAEELVSAYFSLKKEIPQRGHIDIEGERYVLVRAASLSVEFYDLMKTLYGGREAEAFSVAKNLLFHIAHFIGQSDARAFHLKLGLEDPVEKLSAGPIHFAHAGWAFVDISPESNVAPDESFFLVYDHPYSFESDSWLKHGRDAPFPICFMNAGYSSGWCEESFSLPLVATEILCTAKGDPHCRFIMAHPSRIEECVQNHLANHPKTASIVTSYEVPGEFARKELEQKLRVSEDRYRILFENAFDAIVIIEDGKIEHVNRRAAELFGLTRTQIREKDLAGDLSPPTQPNGRPSAEVLSEHMELAMSGKPQVFAWRCLGPMDRVLDTDVSLNRVEGTPNSLQAIFRDVTDRLQAAAERERLESEVRQLQKMDALGNLAGGVAHDFNNLLTGIMGFIKLMRKELPEKSHVHQLADDAKAAMDRGAAMVRHLLTFSRTSQKVTEQVDVNQLVKENLRLLRETIDRRISLVSKLSNETLLTQGDSNQLAQVVINLALNSRDSVLERWKSPAQKTKTKVEPMIGFETAAFSLEKKQAQNDDAPLSGEFIRFTVTDTGKGMNKETRERAFEPFFTTKPAGKGTGLGLTMVYGIVQRHGGWVDIQSEAGESTTVSIYLPRDSEKRETLKVPLVQAKDDSYAGSETVLIVDDETLLRKTCAHWLRERGYNVLTASSGREGIEIFKSEKEKIDIIVLDLTMPQLSGREAMEQILSISPNMPIIVASGYFTNVAANDLLEEGATAILPKPYPLKELTRLIRETLDREE